MTCSAPRSVLAFLLALLAVSSGSGAGELFRPVPSDAQVTRFTRFNIRYTLRDVAADGTRRVEFYITEDMGRSWRLYGEDADRISPMTIQVPGEGVYGFVCVATDRFGNREREPGPRTRPETVIVVDRTPPQAKWVSPLQDILTKNASAVFSWETSDPYLGPTPVTLQYAFNAASNHDRGARWEPMQEKLSASGSVEWSPPETAGRYNFRLVVEDRAGNMTVAYNPTTLTLDSEPPRILGVSPLKSNRLDVDIAVEFDDGSAGSGVKNVTLYTSANNGVLWDLLKETNESGESTPLFRDQGTPIPFKAPQPGDYAVWPVAFDKADNASPIPPRGMPGPYVLTIDTEPPSVTLSNSFLQGRGAVLANETRVVEWTSYDPHPREGAGRVHLSLDNGGSWQEIRAGLSSTGSAVVNFPFGSSSEEAMLRITIEDDFGNVGEGRSQTFRLSAADTVITNIEPAGSQPDYAQPPGGAASFPYPSDDYGTQPPVIPPPPQTSFPGGPLDSPPATTYQPAPPAGMTTDPYIAPDPYFVPDQGPVAGDPFETSAVPYEPPMATDPYSSGLYAPPAPAPAPYPSDAFAPGQNESTAGSFPSAMFTSPQPWAGAPSGAQQSPETPLSASMPPTAAAPSWNPTPAASSQPESPPPFSAPDDVFGGQAAAPPLSDPGPAPGFPIPSAVAPAPPPAAAAPATAAGGSDPFASFDSDGMLAPPPLMDSGTAAVDQAMPPAAAPFDAFGADGLAPPPTLPGVVDAAVAPTTAQTPLPAFDFPEVGQAGAETQPPGFEAPPMPPAAGQSPASAQAPVPAAPAGSPFDTSPAEVAPMPGMNFEGFDDALRPPPMAAGGSNLPSDPRQLSNHYAEEARNYLDEGRIDLALESATRSLNADPNNAAAYSRLAQVHVQQNPPNFPRAATLAKEATNIGRDWYSWWTCADVFYRWSHARNREVQTQIRSGQRPSPDLLDERNQALNNSRIAIGNAAKLVQAGSESDREQVAMTQGEIAYLQALSLPEPVRPAPNAPAAVQDEYRQTMSVYKTSVTPILQEALPYFQTAMQLGGSPSYRETFHIGIINFRLGGLEKDAGNAQQAARHYESAAQHLEEATTATQVPAEGPREAYYMLAYCHDQLAEQPGGDRARQKEIALRYWRRTAEFYAAGSSYRDYAEQRIIALQRELGL